MDAFAGRIGLVLMLSGCAAVDIAPQARSFSESVATATEPLEVDLAAGAAAEEVAARAATIAAGGEVYGPPTACVSAAVLTPGTTLADCTLTRLNPAPEAPGSAKAMLAYVTTLRAYAQALSALAESEAPKEVGTATSGLLQSFAELGALFPEFLPAAQRVAAEPAPVSLLAARFADARRMRLIRQLVRDAGPAIQDILDRLIAYRDPDDGLTEATDALMQAYGRMEDARRSGDRVAYAAAVSGYEGANAHLRARMEASDAGRLILIREAQIALEARLQRGGDLEAQVDLIESLKALSDALSH